MRLGSHVKAAYGTSLTCRIKLVELHKGEGGVITPTTDVETDLKGGESDAASKAAAERGQIIDGINGPLREEMQGESLQQLVAENVRANFEARQQIFGLQKLHLLVERVRLLKMDVILDLPIRLDQLLVLLRSRWDAPIVPNGRVMPALRGLDRPANNRIGKVGRLLLQLRNLDLGRLLVGQNMSEFVIDHPLRVGRVDISHNVEQDVVRPVVGPVPGLDIVLPPGANQTLFANGEALGQSVLPVQRRQDLALNAVLDGVDHGHLRQDRRSLLLQPGGFDPCLHDVAQGVEGHGEHGDVSARGGGRAGRIEHRVVEVGVGVGL